MIKLSSYLKESKYKKLDAMRKSRIVYHINVADLQAVAQEELERDLTDEEIKIVE